jgi:hypothetical protein
MGAEPSLIEAAVAGATRPQAVLGPMGERLTLDVLPAADTSRWVVRRKAQVVAAVNGGLLTLEEACSRYRLTREEFLSWQRAIEHAGLRGLRVSRRQSWSIEERRPPRERKPVGPYPAAESPELWEADTMAAFVRSFHDSTLTDVKINQGVARIVLRRGDGETWAVTLSGVEAVRMEDFRRHGA